MRYYLVLEEGLAKEKMFPLAGRVRIGRSRENEISIPDVTVSRLHAQVTCSGDEVVIEDLGSSNGTAVNGSRIKKAMLRPDDEVTVGTVRLRFVCEPAIDHELQQTQVLDRPVESPPRPDDRVGRSPRLLAALAQVPLFRDLPPERLAEIGQAARLLLFEQGRTVVRQGDRGRSLYLILDGKVEVVITGNQGQDIKVARLGENQFFGEISFLTGAPRTATVKTLEESLICELSNEAMNEVIRRLPAIKGVLQEYLHRRQRELEAKKRAAGMVERRRHPRFNVQLPTRFQVSTLEPGAGGPSGHIMEGITRDLSLSGARIRGESEGLLDLNVGTAIRLELLLPEPWEPVRCLATIRNLAAEQEVVYLGVEFSDIPAAARQTLERYLQS